MSKNKCLRSSDKFESVNQIKNICTTETEKLAEEISWSSSEESLILETVATKHSPNKIKDTKKVQSLTVAEKVEKWLSKTTYPKNKRPVCHKSVSELSDPNQKSLIILNISKTDILENNSEECDCPSSPILNRKKRFNKLVSSEGSGNNAHCSLDENIPISSYESIFQGPTFDSNKLNKNFTEVIEREEGSPILKTNFKKRKLKHSNLKGEKSDNHIKKLFDSDMSQISIDFDCTPVAEERKFSTNSSQSQNIVIASLPRSDSNCTSHQISSYISSPIKTSSDLALETMKSTVTFDATNLTEKSPVKKRRNKFSNSSVAGRLQKLIKKQKSALSVWRHEHYLAANSNFQIPAIKNESLNLKVVKLEEEFGKFVVRSMPLNQEQDYYTVIINNYFVKKVTLAVGSIMKIFKPFSIHKIYNESLGKEELIVINVCRFEICDDDL